MSYVLVEKTSRRGKNGVTMWRLTFYNLDDGVLYETTVDPTYDNFRRSGWDRLVDESEPWGIYSGLKRTRRTTAQGFPVVTADGRPQCQEPCTYQEALKIMEYDYHQRRSPTNFGSLFER